MAASAPYASTLAADAARGHRTGRHRQLRPDRPRRREAGRPAGRRRHAHGAEQPRHRRQDRHRRGRARRGADALHRREGRHRQRPGHRHRAGPAGRHDPDGQGHGQRPVRAVDVAGRRHAARARHLYGQDRHRPGLRAGHRRSGHEAAATTSARWPRPRACGRRTSPSASWTARATPS